MKEGITTRVGRIISGSVNALVDAVENAAPQMVMEEAIREVDAAIDEVRAELGGVLANKHLANTRLMEENRKHEELRDKIELAVKEGRDDLAEAAIAQQLDIEAQLPVLERTIAENAESEKELEGYVNALQAKKREMREELAQFTAARVEAGAGAAQGSAGKGSVAARADKAVSAFDRVLEKNTGLPGTGSPDAQSAAKLAELEALARANRVKERLAAVKAGNKE